MKVTNLYEYFSQKIPHELSEEWDNDGKMLISSDKEVKKVLISLDITPEAVSVACKEGFDLIITHHPMIFTPVRNITRKIILSLIKSDVSVFSFHTRLDSVEGGVNDCLANALGLKNVTPFCQMGRIGELSELTSFENFAKFVKDTLGCNKINYVTGKELIKKVAVLGGGGKDFWRDACDLADVYITGEMNHNTMLDAYEAGAGVIEAGHYFTEFPVCKRIEQLVKEADKRIETKILNFYPVNSL